jgi:ribonuclease P protein component
LQNIFPKQYRLLKSIDYNFVFSKPYKLVDSCFLILARKNKCDYPRLGLVIAKKNVKLAVVRNRIKRIIRESFRYNLNALHGLDVIVIARKKMSILDKHELREQLDRKWVRLRKYYNIS